MSEDVSHFQVDNTRLKILKFACHATVLNIKIWGVAPIKLLGLVRK